MAQDFAKEPEELRRREAVEERMFRRCCKGILFECRLQGDVVRRSGHDVTEEYVV